MENETKLKQAFTRGLGLTLPCEYETLEFSKADGWDSIGHMKLIAAIEETYGIRLDVGDVLALNSYTAARDIVKKYGGKSP